MAQKNQLNLSVSPEVLATLERIAVSYGKPSRNFAGAEALEFLLPFYEKMLEKQRAWLAALEEEIINSQNKVSQIENLRNPNPAPDEQQLPSLSEPLARKRKTG